MVNEMNNIKQATVLMVKHFIFICAVFIVPTSVMAVSDTSVTKRNNNPLTSLPLIKTDNLITLKNSKVVGELGRDKLIEIGSLSNKKLIKISGQFKKGQASELYNPGAMILLTNSNSKKQGVALGFGSVGNTGVYSSRLMIRDKKNSDKEDLDYSFKENERFNVTIEILKPGNYKIRVGANTITKTIQTKLDMLSLQIFSAELLIDNILVK
ncbi:MAG: hypothetical protein OQK95_12535 [Gammaproteobacteria bacterium]|nr:hypothetical protein [Gammaproteobacteria bacterium]